MPAIVRRRFSVGVPELRRGLVYSGTQQRLRRVLARALQGEARRLNVVVVGGSISWGQGGRTRVAAAAGSQGRSSSMQLPHIQLRPHRRTACLR